MWPFSAFHEPNAPSSRAYSICLAMAFLFLTFAIGTIGYFYFTRQVAIDYRNVPVLAAVQDVPGTPWFLLAKVDQEEIYGPLRERALTTGAAVFVLILVAALGVYLLGRNRHSRWLRARLAVERENRLILDSTDEGVLGLDSQGRHVFVNRAASRMLGYEPDELLGKSSHAIWHYQKADGTTYPSDECPIYRSLRDGGVFHSDQEVFWNKGGRSFPVEYTSTPSLETGAAVAAVVTFRDITERKRAEAALRKSEERYRTLFQSSRDAVMTMAPPSWKFTCGNAATAAMFGAKNEAELVSLEPWELSPEVQPDGQLSVEKAKVIIETAMRERSQLFEWTHRRRGGEDFPAMVLLTRVDLDGEAFLQASVRDISAQKQAERRLREEKERLNKVIAAAQDAIIMLDPEGRISMWNETAVRIFGYSPEEALGQNLHELLAPSRFHEKHLEAFHEFRRSGTGNAVGRVLELAALRKDGEEFPAELSLSAVQLEGEWHAVGVLRDITDRKQLDLQQEQYAIALEGQKQAMEELYYAAEAATRAKSEFLANMSHEIRTPMTAILGFSDMLLEEPGIEKAPPRRIEAIHTIQRNGKYLLHLINNILDLSKIEARKLEVERIACSLVQLFADVISLMQIRADAKRLPLTMEFAGGIPESIQTDPLRLRQVLINLVGNAIKFTETGGVRIVARLVQPLGKPAMLQIDVVDTGIGLSQEQISKLFQPFSQADSSMTRKFGGTGLGLTISKRLAESLGGDIAITSSPGQGSTFSVTIDPGPLEGVRLLESPLELAVRTGPAPAEIAASAIRLDCRILLAEDGPDNQRLIVFLLERAAPGSPWPRMGRSPTTKRWLPAAAATRSASS